MEDLANHLSNTQINHVTDCEARRVIAAILREEVRGEIQSKQPSELRLVKAAGNWIREIEIRMDDELVGNSPMDHVPLPETLDILRYMAVAAICKRAIQGPPFGAAPAHLDTDTIQSLVARMACERDGFALEALAARLHEDERAATVMSAAVNFFIERNLHGVIQGMLIA
jgi:hypothetical protein